LQQKSLFHHPVKLALPAGTSYEDRSAEVDSRGNDDDVNPEGIERCSDGSTVVTFDLDSNDLSNVDDPAGDADGTLKLSVQGTRAIGAATVEGRAGYDFTAGSCAEGVIPEAAAVLSVTP
jgi:hypothetical protein